MSAMLKVKIKKGARIMHDHGFFRYPDLMGGNTADLNTVFEAEARSNYWNCVADGYGVIGKYGSGSIFVLDDDGVEEQKP